MTQGKLRFRALDSLRGICACMVVMFHFRTTAVSSLAIFRHSFLFVDFFFVLSGFVIAYGYSNRLAAGFPVRRFLALRLGRIYPLHLFVLLLMTAYECARFAGGPSIRSVAFTGLFSLGDLISSGLLTQIFWPGPVSIVWNVPAWSISAEWWTYVLFAGVCALAPRRIGAVCLAIALASAGWLAVTHGTIEVDMAGSLLRSAFGFMLGVVGEQLLRDRRARAVLDRTGGTVAEVAVIALVGGFVDVAAKGPTMLLGPIIFLAAVLIFALEAGVVSRMLTKPLPLGLGTLSYSIYLTHYVVQFRLTTLLKHFGGGLVRIGTGDDAPITGAPWAVNLLTAAMLLVVVLVAYCTWRWVETPANRWVRRKARMPDSRQQRDVEEAVAF